MVTDSIFSSSSSGDCCLFYLFGYKISKESTRKSFIGFICLLVFNFADYSTVSSCVLLVPIVLAMYLGVFWSIRFYCSLVGFGSFARIERSMFRHLLIFCRISTKLSSPFWFPVYSLKLFDAGE
jgi:ammonia channel protein AmtB